MTGTGSAGERAADEAVGVLTAELFEAARGRPLAVTTLDGTAADSAVATSLSVVAVDRLAHGLRKGGAFSVLLEGPSNVPLAQGLYLVGIAEEPVALFLVPVLRDGEVMQYEVIFT